MDRIAPEKWLRAGYMEKQALHPTEAGSPQGGICSPAIANMASDGLEKELRKRYPKATALSRRVKVNLVRYADDFIITGCTKEIPEQEIKPFVEEFLRERGPELSGEKTKITPIREGFDFLGQHVRKYKKKLLVKPSRKNVKAFPDKIRRIIHDNRQATTGNLISLY